MENASPGPVRRSIGGAGAALLNVLPPTIDESACPLDDSFAAALVASLQDTITDLGLGACTIVVWPSSHYPPAECSEER